MNDVTERLAHFAATIKFDDIPEGVRKYCKTYAPGLIPDSRIQDITAIVSQLEQLDTVRTLMDLLRQSSVPFQPF